MKFRMLKIHLREEMVERLEVLRAARDIDQADAVGSVLGLLNLSLEDAAALCVGLQVWDCEQRAEKHRMQRAQQEAAGSLDFSI